MMHYNELVPPQPAPLLHADRLRLAVAAYLARFKGTSRDHAGSDLRCYLTWCADRSLDPFLARRPRLELYIRWIQEVRRFKPSISCGGQEEEIWVGMIDPKAARERLAEEFPQYERNYRDLRNLAVLAGDVNAPLDRTPRSRAS